MTKVWVKKYEDAEKGVGDAETIPPPKICFQAMAQTTGTPTRAIHFACPANHLEKGAEDTK